MKVVCLASMTVALTVVLTGCKDDKGGRGQTTQTTGNRSGYDTPISDAGQPPPGATGGISAGDGGTSGGGTVSGDGGTASANDPARREALEIFSSRCAACHGPEGEGNGPASAALNPKPRNFKDVAWQKSVTDQHIEKIIEGGGAAVGKSPLMPANPDLKGKPVIQGLREQVRSLGGSAQTK